MSADSLVWREGWTDWQVASQVLPSLANPMGVTHVSEAPLVSAPTAPVVTAAVPLSDMRVAETATAGVGRAKARVRTRPSTSMAIGIVVTLALLAVGLLVTLVIVIQQAGK